MLAIAVALAVFATLAGMALARVARRETGPLIIAVAAGLFFLSLLRRRRFSRPAGGSHVPTWGADASPAVTLSRPMR